MAIDIDDIEVDDYNESEMNRHGVSVKEVRQVIKGDFEVLKNANHHVAPYLIVGTTLAGRWLTIPVAPTMQPGIWRPATAFPARPGDRAKLKR